MKKASRILFLVGGILAIVACMTLVAISVFFFVAVSLYQGGTAPEWVNKLMTSIHDDFGVSNPAKLVLCFGIIFDVIAVFNIPASVFSFICHKKENRGLGLLITATAFSVTACAQCSIAGGVLGIVNWAANHKKEQTQKAE